MIETSIAFAISFTVTTICIWVSYGLGKKRAYKDIREWTRDKDVVKLTRALGNDYWSLR